jgi:hypothetical protein
MEILCKSGSRGPDSFAASGKNRQLQRQLETLQVGGSLQISLLDFEIRLPALRSPDHCWVAKLCSMSRDMSALCRETEHLQPLETPIFSKQNRVFHCGYLNCEYLPSMTSAYSKGRLMSNLGSRSDWVCRPSQIAAARAALMSSSTVGVL